MRAQVSGGTATADSTAARSARGRVWLLAALAAALAVAFGAAARAAEHPAITRAERAIERGDVDPDRDLAPLLQALAVSHFAEERRAMIGIVVDLGATDAQTSNEIKGWLLANAPPVLLDVAKNGNDAFLQGDALYALREMRAPRATLEQAAAIAEADPNEFVQSRGEILRNWIATMPAEDATAGRGTANPERAAAAIAYLDKRAVTVNTQSLRDAARRADADVVRALLDAGIAADTGATDTTDTPLYLAVSVGCTSQGEETDWLVETVQLLVAAGADVNRLDDNRNTALIHAAHWCKGARVIGVLADGGAELSLENGSGLSAFGIAMTMGNLDAAEALVAKGARIDAGEKAMVDHVATSARAKALVARAARK